MKPFMYLSLPLFLLSLMPCVYADTISKAGYYTLDYDITNPSGTTFTITASNVILDLNSHIITGSLIGVDITLGMTNVTVKNGIIANVNIAVRVGASCSNIAISNIRTTACNGNFAALALNGASTQFISNVIVDNCFLDTSTSTAGGNTGRLCNITSCSTVSVRNCVVTANQATASATLYAVLALNSYDILFDGIMVSGNNGGIPAIAFVSSCTGVTNQL